MCSFVIRILFECICRIVNVDHETVCQLDRKLSPGKTEKYFKATLLTGIHYRNFKNVFSYVQFIILPRGVNVSVDV